jgi:hypothetical protein
MGKIRMGISHQTRITEKIYYRMYHVQNLVLNNCVCLDVCEYIMKIQDMQ